MVLRAMGMAQQLGYRGGEAIQTDPYNRGKMTLQVGPPSSWKHTAEEPSLTIQDIFREASVSPVTPM